MAERIKSYESASSAPRFQADTSSQQAAVNAIGRTASAVGAQADSKMRRAAVLNKAGDFAYGIGEWHAKERGKNKPLEPIRDEAGALIPGDMRATLNIERQIYNERLSEKWATAADVDFRKEANSAVLQYKNDPAGYRKHMVGFGEKMLENAPPIIRGKLDGRFSSFTEQQGFTLDQSQYRKAEQRYNASVVESLQFGKLDAERLLLRDGEIEKDERGFPVSGPDGNAAVSSDAAEVYNRIMGQIDLFDDVATAEKLRHGYARERSVMGAKGLYARSIRHLYETGQNTGMPHADYQAQLMDLREGIENGEIPFVGVPGAAMAGLGSMKFTEMSLGQQEEARKWMDAEASRLSRAYEDRETLEFNDFLFKHAVKKVEDMSALRINPNTEYAKYATNYAVPMGVDPMLVMSMMGVESGGNPNATSAENTGGRGRAMGLMQLIPGTWASTRKSMGLDQGNPYDPAQNIQTGVHYISMINKDIDDKFPGLPPREKAMLATVGYYSGQGRLRELMSAANFSPYDMGSWSEYNVGKVLAGGLQPTEKQHVEKVMARYDANTGGSQAVASGLIDEARRRYANDPQQFLKARGAVHDMMRQANSWNEFNDNLTYKPPVMNMDMAKQWVETSWNAGANGMDPNTFAPTYVSITESIDDQNPHKNMLQTAASAKFRSAIGSYKNSSSANTIDALTGYDMRNKMASAGQISALTKGLPQQGSFSSGGAANPGLATQSYFAAGSPNGPFSDFMVRRQTANGLQSNGVPTQEFISFAGWAVENLGNQQTGQIADPVMAREVVETLRKMMQPAQTGMTPGAGYGSRQQELMFENIAKQVGSTKGKGSDFKRSMKYLWRNQEAILSGDPDAVAGFRARVNGEAPPDAVKYTGEEEAAQLTDTLAELDAGGYQAAWRSIQDKLPNGGHVAGEVKEYLREVIVDLMPDHAKDEAEELAGASLDQGMASKRLGIAPYVFAADVLSNDDYRPGQPIFGKDPWLPPANSFVANREVYDAMGEQMITVPTRDGGTEELPASQGTAAGLIQAAYDSTKREGAQDIDIFQELGKSIFIKKLTSRGSMHKSPGGKDADILEIVQRNVNDEGHVYFEQLTRVSTGAMVDIQASEASAATYANVVKNTEGRWVRVLREAGQGIAEIGEAFTPTSYTEDDWPITPTIGPKELIVDPVVGTAKAAQTFVGGAMDTGVKVGSRIADMANILMED